MTEEKPKNYTNIDYQTVIHHFYEQLKEMLLYIKYMELLRIGAMKHLVTSEVAEVNKTLLLFNMSCK